MNIEIEDSVITSGLPQAIEFRQSHTIREGFSSNVTSTVSPLRLEPVNFHEQALFKTIRDQAKRSGSNHHSGIRHIDRVDPPACTSQLSEDKLEGKIMIVNTLDFEANLLVMETDNGKATTALDQTVDVSVEESNIDPATRSVEEKLRIANAKLEAVQIMLEISKLEAEAKAKAAEVAILKAKLALKEAKEGANTRQGAGNGNKDTGITESIERIIANAESQIIIENTDIRADSAHEASFNDEDRREENSIVDGGIDCALAPSLNDSEFDGLPAPPSLVYESDTSEAMPIIINLVNPPSIIRQSSVPSPSPESPEKSALESCGLEQTSPLEASEKKQEDGDTNRAKYTKSKPEQSDENNIRSKNNDGIDSTLEFLYTKIEECRTKLMDPNSSMDDQTAAAQLMTQYAKSAQALKKAFKVY
jgi:hypothetical protein